MTAHVRALEMLISDLDQTNSLIAATAQPWSRLSFDDRREIGERWPELADGLVGVERHWKENSE